MKRAGRTARFRLQISLLLILAILAACGGPWRDGYFKKGVDRLTQEEILEKMGPPHTAKTPALGGDTIWTYRVPVQRQGTESDGSVRHHQCGERGSIIDRQGTAGRSQADTCIATATP